MNRRRVFCEMCSIEEVVAPATVALLSRYRVDPILATWPSNLRAMEGAVKTFTDAGLRPAVWPMIADVDGRWLGTANVDRFIKFVDEVHRVTQAPEIVLDLEPPIDKLRGALALRELPIATDIRSFTAASATIARMVTDLRDASVIVTATIPPPALLPGFELLLGTPVAGIPWDSVSPMLYASILEGWSRGVLRREDARAFVAWGAKTVFARYRGRAAVSLGAVGTGALGTEPVYRSPDELADDTAIAIAAGVSDLALFELGGVLRRTLGSSPRPEAWLEAFTDEPTSRPEPATGRIEALVGGALVASSFFSRFMPT